MNETDTFRRKIATLQDEIARLTAALAASEARAAALEAAAHEDPLTGALNRRGFERDLTRAIAYKARYGTPLALLVGDLDRFKAVNDTHGHAAGDALLRHVAQVLRAHIRASDSVGRLGGDEFALILWQLDEEMAERKMQDLQDRISAQPVPFDGIELAAGLSMGVTALEAGDTMAAALARADKVLYANKEKRRAIRR
jgi:diguanylate cyclase (GGDEF)-like protein